MPADPSPCRAQGGTGGSGQATRPRSLSPTKFLRVDFFCEQKCDFFFFVIYVNKVVLVLFFFTKWIVPELRYYQT